MFFIMAYTITVLFAAISYVRFVDAVTSPITPTPPTLPTDFYSRNILEHIHLDRIANMTRELIMDVKGQFRHLRLINNKYKELQDYQLGILSAVVQTSFKDILTVYSEYCTLEVFQNNTYLIAQYLVAYHFMQGQFSDLKLQKSLYYETKENFRIRYKFLSILGQQLKNRYGTNKAKLLKLERLPEVIVNDKENLGRELIERDIAPRRVDVAEVQSVVDMSVDIEKVSRRSNAYMAGTGRNFDAEAMWNKVMVKFDKFL